MKEGKICDIARKQARSLMTTAAIVLLVCLVVLAFNWKYIFNWVAGPFPFTAALAANPGAREFVTVKGTAVSTGYAEESTLKLKGKIPLSKTVSAEYMTVLVQGKTLIVQAPPGVQKNMLEGRLVPVPSELAQALHVDSGFYPCMLAAKTGYRWDFNLLVLGAAILFPFAFFFLILFVWRAGSLERTPAIADLRRFGEPRQVLEKIEAEAESAGEKGEVGPLIFTTSWLIIFEPLLNLIAVSEIVGVAQSVRYKKAGAEAIHLLNIWLRGKPLPEELQLGEAVVAAAFQRVQSLYPWTIIENPKEFGAKWLANRPGCEQEFAQRKKAAHSPTSMSAV